MPIDAGVSDDLDPGRSCVLLDVDGTLLDLVNSPEQVQVPPQLVADLGRLLRRLDGALALVSGRPIEQLDGLFQPLRLPASGVHGVELRLGGQLLRRRTCPPELMEQIRGAAEELITGLDGTSLELKPSAVAVHYRRQPDAAGALRAGMRELAARHREQFALLDGDMVLELVPRGCTKSAAIEAIMEIEPFRGRQPIYLGDDTTDVGAFEMVRRYHGVDVAVGNRVTARWRLSDPAAVRRWIADVAAGAGSSS